MTYHNFRDLFMRVEIEREEDGRWIAEIPELPGVMVYGEIRKQAIAKAEALALRVMDDRFKNDEEIPELREVFAVSA
jgi:predicted RNase H-like HicB family nuclease